MQLIRVRPMTADEFDAFHARTIRNYAAEQVRSGKWAEDGATGRATALTDQLLPHGTESSGMLLLTGIGEDDAVVGSVWVALQSDLGPGESAWIYDIEIVPEKRGAGYGRALLQAAERAASEHGAVAVGLNVFGDNAVARSLYTSAGYEITSLYMRKELRPSN